MWFENKAELFSDFPGRWEAFNENNEEEEFFSMPCFEVSNAEDRPFAPPAEDYPIGCEVELRDVDFARLAQESKNWDSILDLLFAKPRRMVKVTRHDGDYTFVECTDISGYNRVGCTLYRACLSEPKVKTTKYFAGIASCANKNYEDDEEENSDSNKISQFYHHSDFSGKFDRSEKSEISLEHDEWASPMREYNESFNVMEHAEHENKITGTNNEITTTNKNNYTTIADNNVEHEYEKSQEVKKNNLSVRDNNKRIHNKFSKINTSSSITPQQPHDNVNDRAESNTANMTEARYELNHTSLIDNNHAQTSYNKRHTVNINNNNNSSSECKNVFDHNNMTNSETKESSNHDREKREQGHTNVVILEEDNVDKIINSDIDLEALLSEQPATDEFTSQQHVAPHERSRIADVKTITDINLEQELLHFVPHDKSTENNHYTKMEPVTSSSSKDVIDTLQITRNEKEGQHDNNLISQEMNVVAEVMENTKRTNNELGKAASKSIKPHIIEKPPLVNVSKKYRIHNEYHNINKVVNVNDENSNTQMYQVHEDLNRASKKVSRRSVRPITRELISNKQPIVPNVSSAISDNNINILNKNILDGNKDFSNISNSSKNNQEKNDEDYDNNNNINNDLISKSGKGHFIKRNEDITQTPSGKSAMDNNNNSNNHSNICPTDSNMVRSRLHHHNRFALAMRKGTQAINKHNYEQALFYYNLALSELPEEESRVISSRSVAYLLMNEPEKALEDAKRVIELEPNSFLGYVRAGNVLRSMKMMGEAQSCYKEAFQRDPHNAVVRKLLMSNSVAMLYETRVKRCLRFKIVYDDVRNQIVAVARQGAKAGDVLLKESTSLFATLNYFTFESSTPELHKANVSSEEHVSDCNRGRFCRRAINRHESTTNSILSIRSVDNDMDNIEEWNENFDSVNSVYNSNTNNSNINNNNNGGTSGSEFYDKTNANNNSNKNGNNNGSSANYQNSRTHINTADDQTRSNDFRQTNKSNMSHATPIVESVKVCGHCCTPLIDVDEVCQRTADLDATIVRSFYISSHWVRCNYECGTLYCSEECRTRAWAESHWVECVKHGRWRIGIHALFTYLHQCERSPRLMKRLINSTHSSHQGNSEGRNKKNNESSTIYCSKELFGSNNIRKKSYNNSTSSCAEEDCNNNNNNSKCNDNTKKNENTKELNEKIDENDIKIQFIIACMRITIRMLCRMLSCVWTLQDALHMYDWLRIYSTVSAERARLWPFVHHCYNLLSQSFYGRERQRLTYEVFERCFERVRSNAIIICVSAWDKIYLRAESHLALTRSDSTDSKNLQQHFAEKEKVSENKVKRSSDYKSESVEAMHSASNSECVRTIMNAPAYGLPGTYTISVALFELYAATLPEKIIQQANTESIASTETESTETVEVSSLTCSSNAHSSIEKENNEDKTTEKRQQLKSNSKWLLEQKRVNCRIKSKIESSACLHLCAIKNLVRGEPLISQNMQQVVENEIMWSYKQSATPQEDMETFERVQVRQST